MITLIYFSHNNFTFKIKEKHKKEIITITKVGFKRKYIIHILIKLLKYQQKKFKKFPVKNDIIDIKLLKQIIQKKIATSLAKLKHNFSEN